MERRRSATTNTIRNDRGMLLQEVPLVHLEGQSRDKHKCVQLLGAEGEAEVPGRLTAPHSDDALQQEQNACAGHVTAALGLAAVHGRFMGGEAGAGGATQMIYRDHALRVRFPEGTDSP